MSSFLSMPPYTDLRASIKRTKMLDKVNDKLKASKGKLPPYGISFEEFFSWMAGSNLSGNTHGKVVSKIVELKLVKTQQLIQTMQLRGVAPDIDIKSLSASAGTYIPKPDPAGRALIRPHELLKNDEYKARQRTNKFMGESELIQELNQSIEEDAPVDFFTAHYLQYFLWSLNKVVYRIPRQLWHEGDESLLSMPTDPLRNCPQWCTFIGLDTEHDMSSPLTEERSYSAIGIYYSTINYGGKDLFLISMVSRPTHLGHAPIIIYWVLDLEQSNIGEALKATDELNLELDEKKRFGIRFYSSARDNHGTMESFLDCISSILFVNTEYREQVAKKVNLVKRLPRRKINQPYVLDPRPGIVEYEVYEELGQLLTAQQSAGRDFTSRKAHIRKGHWHGYWTGPRSGEQKYILRWLFPKLIRGTIVDDNHQ